MKKKKQKSSRVLKILKITIILFLIFYCLRGYAISFNRAMEIQRSQQALEDATVALEEMSVPELIKHLAPENATVLSRVAFCESSHNPDAIHYNDGGKGKHSVGILQFQEATFLAYEKKMGEDLNYYSTYDQIKVADFMLNENQGRQWTCYRKIYGV
jgi:hypothetical protein